MSFPAVRDAKTPSRVGEDESPVELGGLRVQVVDDDDEVTAAALAMHVTMGCQVQRAGDTTPRSRRSKGNRRSSTYC